MMLVSQPFKKNMVIKELTTSPRSIMKGRSTRESVMKSNDYTRMPIFRNKKISNILTVRGENFRKPSKVLKTRMKKRKRVLLYKPRPNLKERLNNSQVIVRNSKNSKISKSRWNKSITVKEQECRKRSGTK